ncbi:MAG: peptide chain release factor N(5)-glutamine methyltransferase [Candidatus Ratteibacteria bacterium]
MGFSKYLTLQNVGIKILKKNKIENPEIETEILLSEILGIERYQIYTEKIELSKKIEKKFLKFIKQRVRRIPLQYIIKKTYFFDTQLKIEKGVFIPRPETELLVEKIIKIYKENFLPESVKILDIGTGCGNIAICLAKNIENSYVIGIDISKKSLKIAKENARLNNVENKINFKYSNLFSNINDNFDIIVSNPPYISENEYPSLSKEIKYEPKRAIIGGKDGLKIIKKILKECPKFLKNNGYLILEVGYKQSDKIKEIKSNKLTLISIEKDLQGYERVMVFKKN